MKLHSLIVDDFFEDFAGWRSWADICSYVNELNPLDGVTYPAICKAVPTFGTQQRLQQILGAPVEITAAFMRLSPGGVHVPHYVHTDSAMGTHSLMVYFNRPEHCRGGTSLVRHVTGLDSTPEDDEGLELWRRDANRPEQWTPYLTCEMRPNRAFLFRSDLMHCASPMGGFGQAAKDARLVMTAFFNA
jgi:hypothetical protein